jgi:hypothetical protein
MEVRYLEVRRLALALILMNCLLLPLSAQTQPAPTAKARIALFEPCGQTADAALAAALCTVADSVELSLVCLQRYEVRRVAAVDPTRDLDKVRVYCQANRIDQAIAGSGSARPTGGYAFQLVVYDRRSDSIILSREGASTGALDMFDTTDELVAALLDGLSGEHLLFGSLVIETDPPGALVSVNGTEAGPSPLSLRGLPVGKVTVGARSSGRETAETSVTIVDSDTVSASLRLARSMGTLALNMPEDAAVLIRGTDPGEVTIRGSEPRQIPTGTYEVQASCPGLAPVTQTIEIPHNRTFSWTPWAKGYLDVQSEPAGAMVIVDGTERGSAPLIVEVDPGVLHRVELKKDKYEPYLTEVSAAAARKVSVKPKLAGTPGSIQVNTIPPGATAYLDEDKTLTTPGTFDGVLPGAHTVSFDELFVNRRYYSSPEAVTVNVNPGDQSTLSHELVPGSAKLTISEAPPSSSVAVDGKPVDATVLTSGAVVPAGDLAVAVSSPAGQNWRLTYSARPGTESTWTPRTMTASLPRRTITVDGNGDDWEGIWPCWQGRFWTSFYPNQPGTRLARTFVCRDDDTIYWRMDFANGTPSPILSKYIDDKLVYVMRLMDHGDLLTVELSFDRQRGVATGIRILHSFTNQSSTIKQDLKWAAGNSMLEVALPVAAIRNYIANGPWSVDFDVATVNSSGHWVTSVASDRISIDFVR